MSEEYNLLCMMDLVIKNFPNYKRETDLSESSHLRIFEKILEPILVNSRVIFKDGETVCRSTQRMQISNEVEVTYGRHIDLLVTSNLEEKYEDTELCSIEFKRSDELESVLKSQQNKNIRINACIFNDISLLLGKTTLPIVYLDFSERSAYIVELFKYQDCFVAHKVGKFIIMKSLLEVESFRNQVISLYTWRQYVTQCNVQLSLACINQINKYVLADVADISPIRSPRREVKPVKIFLSPSKDSKRTRSVFEHDE